MEKQSPIVSFSLVSILCLVLVASFAPYQIIDNCFQLFPVACGVGLSVVVASVLLIKRPALRFTGCLSDLLLFLAVVYYAVRYSYADHLADWKVCYAVLLLLYWLACRVFFSSHLISKKVLFYGLAIVVCVQAVWGLLQLYGVVRSYHNLYAMTGSFYNPGPYTGYIVMFFPVCLSQLLVTRKAEFGVWLFIAALLVCVVPAGLSRSAWVALLAGCLFVLIMRFGLIGIIRRQYKERRAVTAICGLSVLLLGLGIGVLFFMMKPGSAYGRLFIWKNTCSAIAKSPVSGYGPGSFPYVYGQEQARYFSEGNYAEWEQYVAGAPEYAFNEYLQLLVEGGLVLFVLAIVFLFYVLYRGIRAKQYGVCGALVAFAVFACFAYPLQVLPFGLVVVLWSALCVSGREDCAGAQPVGKPFKWAASILACALSVGCICRLENVRTINGRIRYANKLYAAGLHAESFSLYEKDYRWIAHNPRILLHYARILSEQKQYKRSIEVLERAEKVCNDIAILHLKASVYQKTGEYALAEKAYRMSMQRMPVRIYPCYMLAKLYSLPEYFHKEKMEEMARIVLDKKPKVHSKAIEEMKQEARQMLGGNKEEG